MAGWSAASAHAVAAFAEVLVVPDSAFDGAALLVSVPQGGNIDEVTDALVGSAASVRACTLVGTHAARYRVEGPRPTQLSSRPSGV